MKIILFFFLVASILFSCVKTEKKYTKFLTNGKSKYWNLVYESDGYKKKNAYLYPICREYYNTNGTWFLQEYEDGVFVKLETGDVLYPDTWKLSGDSVIIYNEDDSVRILMLTNDTLKYLTKKGDTLIFRNSTGDRSFNYSYYRLDDIDSLKVYSLDSIRGNLIYYRIRNDGMGIRDDSVGGLIVPITIYKTNDEFIKDNLFHFVFEDEYFHNNIKAIGKLNKVNGRYFSNLRFYRTDYKNYKKLFIDSMVLVNIYFKNDSLWINNKLFKKDEKGRIFKKYRGY